MGRELLFGLVVALSWAVGCATGTTPNVGTDDDGTTGPAGPGGATAGPGPGSGGAGPVGPGAGPGGAGAGGMGSGGAPVTSSASSASSAASSGSGGGACTPVNLIDDGGLEAGPGGGAWAETSTNFGTPICDVTNCGTGGGTGPAAGLFWAWFGGITLPEIATLSQSVVIGAGGPATLSFQLEIPSCESAADWFYVEVDGTQVFFTDGADLACGQIGYQLVTLNLNAYADGLAHTITFVGDTVSFLTATNFMVDQITLLGCP